MDELSSNENDWELQLALYESQKREEERLQRERLEQQRIRQQEIDDREREEEFHRALEASRNQFRQEQLVEQDAELAADLQVTETLQRTEAEDQRAASAVATEAERRHHREQESLQGSWDCTVCTYRNAPYHGPSCQVCQAEPPSHVLTFCQVPQRIRFGVELELVIPNGIRDGYTCEWIAKQMTQIGVTTLFQGYSHETMADWKIVTDSSLSASRHDLCLELVSPILCGERGLVEMRRALESIRKLGIAINESCGFHIHVDASSGSQQALASLGTLEGCKMISQDFVLLETAFDALVASSGRSTRRQANRHRYCQSNLLAFGSRSPRQIWDRIENVSNKQDLVQLVCPDRYHKLNLTNLIKPDRPDTVEFRQHGGVDQLITAEAWVRLIIRFCQQATTSNLSSSWASGPPVARSQNLSRLFELIQCPGLQSFYTIEGRLFPAVLASSEQEGRGEWRCRVCKKRFRYSQDLSNHCRSKQH